MMKFLESSESRVSFTAEEVSLPMGPLDASLLQSAIVDAAIAFRLANLEYDECCEKSGTDDLLCDNKLAFAVQNKSMLFALVDKLLTRHPLNA